MPIRDSAPLGAPCWIDLTTSDVARAQDFYGTVFGWTFESAGPEYGGYVNAAKGGHPVAGIMANRSGAEAPDRWVTYFHTADIQTTLAAVTAAGGSVCMAMEVPAKGHMGLATDPPARRSVCGSRCSTAVSRSSERPAPPSGIS